MSTIEQLKSLTHEQGEFEVASATILLLDKRGYNSHYFNWHLELKTQEQLTQYGVTVTCGQDSNGKFTLVKW